MDKLVPKRRFKEFKDADAWEKRRFSNICSMHARIGWQNLRTSEFLDEGDYYLVTGTDFDNGKINFETCHYVEKVRFEQDKNIQLKDGNILITKDGTLGKVAIVEGLDKPATLNAGVFNIEIKEDDANNIYVYQYLKAPFLMDYVARHATGGTIKHLNQNILINFPVWMSCLEEQMRVGHFLQQLDNIITLQQRKLDKLKNMKSALLYEMFPVGNEKKPRRRLAGFTDDWEQRKLGEYVKITTGKLDANAMIENGKYDFYTSGTKKYKIDVPAFEGPAITIAGNGATVGYMHYAEGAFNAYQRTYVLNDFRILDRTFAFQEISRKLPKKISEEARTGNIPYIVMDMLTELNIIIPPKEEQEKIGTFFQQLDNSITLQQRKVDKLKDLKKAYLNEMFV